jgi:hypothetical protein
MCGKYDRDRAGSQWLSNGFARAFNSSTDMADIVTFTGGNVRWSSIDCRPIINSNSMWMMHAGTDDTSLMPNSTYGSVAQNNGMVRFTNIMSDVLADSTNLFDTARDDMGTCRPVSSGGIATYNRTWANLGK